MKRRDITLGEMQDECKRVKGACNECNKAIRIPCESMVNPAAYFIEPNEWDLVDALQFNEAQMSLLKIFYERGFRKVYTGTTRDPLLDSVREFLGLGEGVRLDLAELLEKDGAK